MNEVKTAVESICSRLSEAEERLCELSDRPLEIIQSGGSSFPRGQGQRICLPLPGTQEGWVPSPGREDPLEGEMATLASILAWGVPWTEEPGKTAVPGVRVRHDLATENAHSVRGERREGSES